MFIEELMKGVRKELNVVTNKTDHLLRAGFASFSMFLPIIFRVVEKSSGVSAWPLGVRHYHRGVSTVEGMQTSILHGNV